MPPPSTGASKDGMDPGNVLSAYTPGENEKMQDFAAPDANVARPSDFVGFSDFAGLNDEQMRGIADRAAAASHQARSGAAGYLKAAQDEATAETPVEKTASYSKYLDAMSKAGDASNAAVTNTGTTTFDDEGRATGYTGNFMEDALRGVYRDAQNNRDDRDAAYSAGLGNINASNRNTYLATQKKLAGERAAAEAKRQAAVAAAAAAAAANVNDAKRQKAAQQDAQQDAVGRKTGRVDANGQSRGYRGYSGGQTDYQKKWE